MPGDMRITDLNRVILHHPTKNKFGITFLGIPRSLMVLDGDRDTVYNLECHAQGFPGSTHTLYTYCDSILFIRF